jgi:DNA-binding XRE family transcriptional regulator
MTLRATASTLGVSPTLLSECEQGRSHQAVTLHRMLAERLACKGAQ